MLSTYEVDFQCVSEDFDKEQRKYYVQTGQFANLNQKFLAGPGSAVLEMDLREVSTEELKSPTKPLRCSMNVTKDGDIAGFCGYFDVDFKGCPVEPDCGEVKLTTEPDHGGTTTHW